MVQTKAGAKTNEWLLFMQGCRAAYREHKASLPPKPKPKVSPKKRRCKQLRKFPSPCELAELRQVESRVAGMTLEPRSGAGTLLAYAADQSKRSAVRSNECGAENGMECEAGEPPPPLPRLHGQLFDLLNLKMSENASLGVDDATHNLGYAPP